MIDLLPDRELWAAVFQPRSLAIIGASTDADKLGARILRILKSFPYTGRLYPIHPTETKINGLPAYPDLESVPDSIDQAIVTVPSESLGLIIRACGRKRVRVVQVLTASLSQRGEEELARHARETGMRIIGPNAIGIYCPDGGLACTPGASPLPGHIALISQSGGLLHDAVMRGKASGLRFSKAVSIGNCADLTATDFLDHLTDDTSTRVVGVYLEGITDGRAFVRALDRACRSKPVVVLKAGRSLEGRRAIMTHTGSLAGDHRVWSAVLKQCRAVEVRSLDELLAVALLLSTCSRPFGANTALLGNGGGATVLASDLCAAEGLQLASLSESTLSSIRASGVPPSFIAQNPLDIPANALLGRGRSPFRSLIAPIASDPGIDQLVVHLNVTPFMGFSNPESSLRQLVDVLCEQAPYRIPVLVVLRTHCIPEMEAIVARVREPLETNQIPVLSELDVALKAIGACTRAWK